MKERIKRFNKRINIKTSYLVGLSTLSLILVCVFFSYAIFNIKIEKSGALNIVTANLYYKIESTDLDANNQIIIQPKGTKQIEVRITNLNSVKTAYNLWYKSNIPNNVQVTYDPVNDTSKGDMIDAYTSTNNSKLIKVILVNDNTTAVTISLGVRGGLFSKPLALEKTESAIPVAPFLKDALVTNLGVNGTVYEP
ncbi:MAG: hypothetical protein RR359_03835, partial [Bacilli bacterium]